MLEWTRNGTAPVKQTTGPREPELTPKKIVGVKSQSAGQRAWKTDADDREPRRDGGDVRRAHPPDPVAEKPEPDYAERHQMAAEVERAGRDLAPVEAKVGRDGQHEDREG